MLTKEDCWKMYIAWSNAEIRYREMGWAYNERIARYTADGWLKRYESLWPHVDTGVQYNLRGG